MRVTTRMGYGSFLTNLSKLQQQNYYDKLRQATGVDIQTIAEAPTRLMDVKKIIAQKDMKDNYVSQNSYAISEMESAEDQAAAIATAMQQIRDLSVTSTNIAYDGSVASIGTYIKGIMEDMLRNANADFNGKYMFSGTKTDPKNIQAEYPDMNNMPFEFVEGEATTDNPSGISIVFKGNTDARTINKDGHTNEMINMTAEDLFGEGGTAYFQPIIDIYNILQFQSDGTPRDTLDSLNTEEKRRINELQTQVANNVEKVNKNTAIFASRRNRIDTVNQQMKEEVIRLDEVKSLKEDADMAKVLTRIAQEETALQYSLQAGATIQQFSLFNFLS
jgi:flagellin-like hook-associated protein FlgL